MVELHVCVPGLVYERWWCSGVMVAAMEEVAAEGGRVSSKILQT
jgi:hypothetical protein